MAVLTDKQEQFCVEYLKDFNGTQAAIRAGYSPNGARKTAHDLKEDPRIQARLQQGKQEMSERSHFAIDELLRRRDVLGMASMGQIMQPDETGKYLVLKRADDLTKDDMAVIEAIDVTHDLDTDGRIVSQRIKLKIRNPTPNLHESLKRRGLTPGKPTIDDEDKDIIERYVAGRLKHHADG